MDSTDDQALLTIGAFARAVGLAPSALRHYDECGLLTPAEVDGSTGYRYYTPELARRAQAIARMRHAGFSIEVMRVVLDGTSEDLRRVLEEVREEQAALAERRAEVLEDLLDPAEDAPVAAGPSNAHRLLVGGRELAAAIRQVRSAADTDPASPLSGILLDATTGTLDVVATNRHWMAIRTLPEAAGGIARSVVSLPDAARLAATLDQCERAELEADDDRIGIADIVVPTRDVAYPAHRMLLDGLPATATRVLAPRDELLGAIDAAGRAEVDVDVTDDGLRVEGRAVSAVVEGPGIALRLGAALARRALSATLGPEVLLHLASPTQAIRLTSPYQHHFLALVMPVAR